MFVSIDPGYRVGVATFREDGSDLANQIIPLDDFKGWLKGLYQYSEKFDEKIRFLYEDFTLRQDKAMAQTGSDMPASRCIGMVEMMHWMLGEQATIAKSSPRNIITAMKWAGRSDIAAKMQRNRSYHPADNLVAYAHGVMWLIELKVRKHPIFES